MTSGDQLLTTFQLDEILIEITTKCFLKCLHCSVYDPLFQNKEMDLKDMKNIVDDFVSLGGKTLHFSGGEPLSHPHLFEMIEYAKENKLDVRLFTCGIIDGATPHIIAEKLANLQVDKIGVSLHGSNSKTHDIMTQKQGSFQRTVNLIKSLLSHNLDVKVNFVPVKLNFEEIEDLIDYCAKLGVKEVRILRFVPQGRGMIHKETLKLTKDEFSALVEFVSRQRGRTDIEVNVGTPFDFCFIFNPSLKPRECKAGINECVIKVNGDIIPCPAYFDLTDYTAGNVLQSSLREIWMNSKVFDKIRKFDYRKLKGQCATCEDLDVCKGRCPAQRIHEYGDVYQGPDPYCPRYIS